MRVETPPDKITGDPPQDDRDPLFLINSLLTLARETRGFRAGGVHWKIWQRRHIEDYEGHFSFRTLFQRGRPARRGNELLQVLLAQAMSSLKEDLGKEEHRLSDLDDVYRM
jgi:hypothetical protein